MQPVMQHQLQFNERGLTIYAALIKEALYILCSCGQWAPAPTLLNFIPKLNLCRHTVLQIYK